MAICMDMGFDMIFFESTEILLHIPIQENHPPMNTNCV